MLSMDRARQFYLENRDKFPGMSMSDAVVQIARSGGMPAAAGTAQPMAPTVPATPVPVMAQVTPPMAVPEAAPQEEAEPAYVGPATSAFEAFKKARAASPEPTPQTGGKVDFLALQKQRFEEAQYDALEQEALAEQNAKVDPELQKILQDRVTRTTAELENVDADRKQAIWMAIAQSGLQMAQSQSPYFLQALASGIEAGLNGYNESQAKADEKKSRLQQIQEDLAIKAIEVRQQAQADAVARARASVENASAREQLAERGLRNIIMGETAGAQIEEGNLRNELLREQILGSRQSRALAAYRNARRGGAGATTSVPGYDVREEEVNGVKRTVLFPEVPGAVALVEGPGGKLMPKRYADNPEAYADAARAVEKAGGVGFDFSPSGDMYAIRPNGSRVRIIHRV